MTSPQYELDPSIPIVDEDDVEVFPIGAFDQFHDQEVPVMYDSASEISALVIDGVRYAVEDGCVVIPNTSQAHGSGVSANYRFEVNSTDGLVTLTAMYDPDSAAAAAAIGGMTNIMALSTTPSLRQMTEAQQLPSAKQNDISAEQTGKTSGRIDETVLAQLEAVAASGGSLKKAMRIAGIDHKDKTILDRFGGRIKKKLAWYAIAGIVSVNATASVVYPGFTSLMGDTSWWINPFAFPNVGEMVEGPVDLIQSTIAIAEKTGGD